MQFTSKRASVPTAACIRGVVHKSGPCDPHPGCLLTLPFLPPQLSPSFSPCKFEKASLRLATHFTRENISTHFCSQPYKSGFGVLAVRLRANSVLTSSVCPPEPLLPYSDTYWCQSEQKAAWPLQTHFSDLGRWGLTKALSSGNSSSLSLQL